MSWILKQNITDFFQALANAGKNADTAEDYVLVEVSGTHVTSSADEQQQHEQFGHRILPANELIMDSVACWNGSVRRFIIRKKGTVGFGNFVCGKIRLLSLLSLF